MEVTGKTGSEIGCSQRMEIQTKGRYRVMGRVRAVGWGCRTAYTKQSQQTREPRRKQSSPWCNPSPNQHGSPGACRWRGSCWGDSGDRQVILRDNDYFCQLFGKDSKKKWNRDLNTRQAQNDKWGFPPAAALTHKKRKNRAVMTWVLVMGLETFP